MFDYRAISVYVSGEQSVQLRERECNKMHASLYAIGAAHLAHSFALCFLYDEHLGTVCNILCI